MFPQLKSQMVHFVSILIFINALITAKAVSVEMEFYIDNSQVQAYAKTCVNDGSTDIICDRLNVGYDYAYFDALALGTVVEEYDISSEVFGRLDCNVTNDSINHEYLIFDSYSKIYGSVDNPWYGGYNYGWGDSEVLGTLTIDSTGILTPGSTGLLLQIDIDFTENECLFYDAYIQFYSNDLANPIDITMGISSSWSQEIPVLAGQEIDIEFSHYFETDMVGFTFGNEPESQFIADITLIPEPATILLLGLGGLTALNRRRLFNK